MLIYTSMKKRLLTITVAALAIAFCSFAFAACGEETGAPEFDPYPYYTLTKIGETLTLDVSLKSQLPSGAITLPASSYYYADTEGGEVKKHDAAVPVSAVADGAFERAGRITSVTVGNTYTELGTGSFAGCDGLTSVTLSDKITAVPDSAFAYCINLKSVTGGGEIKSVGKDAFLSCGKLNTLDVTWANNFDVGESAFFYAISLRNIDLTRASSVKSHAFKGWQESQKITEPSDKSAWASDWRD